MLTIGQLAAHVGMTVRAVRFYHQKGLLPEPERDSSGYRRYDAAAVVELVRIRTLADAGVPLSRVRELLAASPPDFAVAIEDLDRQLRVEIRERQEHRRRIAQLASGESLTLPPEAVEYLEHLRALGFPDRMVQLERDAWILVAAQLPKQMQTMMTLKRAQLDSPAVIETYEVLLEAAEWEDDDPRVPAVADRLVALIEATSDEESEALQEDFAMSDDLVDLLDSVFLDSVPIGRRLLVLMEERGWTGWTRLERIGRQP